MDLFFSRQFKIFRERFKRKEISFFKRGHEKVTVKIIPHNQKEIYTFQITKFIFLFFFGLFFLVAGISFWIVFENQEVKKEEERLVFTYEGIKSDLNELDQSSKKVLDLIGGLKPDFTKLYEFTVGTDKTDFYGDSKLDDSIPKEIKKLKQAQKDLISLTNIAKAVKNFVNVRSDVVSDTPSIVSNQGHITSLFGWRRSPFGYGRDFHTGIDIAAVSGTIIRATAPGIVTTAGWGGGYGNMVKIKHKYGFETIYGHQKAILVKKGQRVKKGQIIGYVGQTGNSTGNHCHYEIRLGGVPINPYPYMSRVW